jgi:hypothetical protein
VKISDLTPDQWYARLNTRAYQQYRDALQWWRYMDLEQELVYVARILAEQDNRFAALLLPWSELVIEAVVERLRHEAFLSGEKPIEDLTKTWVANDLEEASDEAHTASAVAGMHFIMIGPDGPGGYPMVTTEYCDQVAVELHPRTGQPIAGLKKWREDTFDGFAQERAALYVADIPGITDRNPGVCRVYELNDKGKMVETDPLGDWSRVIANDASLPSVPFVPMLTNPRRGTGISDLKQLRPALDSANQFATNMMAAGEHHAVGRKYAVGVSPSDFVDENGDQVPLWKVAMGDVWAIPYGAQKNRSEPSQEIKVGQFSASDLRNFHESLKTIAQVAASKYGLPPLYMGYSSDNPASAEAIQFSLERLVLRATKRQLWYGGGWKRSARIQWAIMGKDPADIAGIESKWANPATPTMASKMDAAVKGVSAGIIDDEQAWVDLGYSEQTKKGLRERKAKVGFKAAADLTAVDQIPTTLPQVNGAPALRS